MRRIVHLFAFLALGACIDDLQPRPCRQDADCLQGGVEGTCLSSPTSSESWCAFLNGRCPGGLEWGTLAGEGLGRTCVSPAAAVDAPPGSTADAPPRVEADADVTPPTTTLIGKPSAISGPDVTFMFEADETAQFECSLDGAPFAGCSSPKGYTGLSALPDPHRFEVRARDTSGNLENPPVEYDWEVDPNALDTNLTATPPATSGRSVMFTFTSTRAGTFECKLEPLDSAFAACTSPKTYAGLTDDRDPYTFSVRAVDAAMNVDPSPATYRWNVDSTGPTPTISSPTGTVGPQPMLVFQTEVGGKYTCHVDSQPEGDCLSGTHLPTLGAGAHVVYVTGTDSFGNVGAEQSSAFTVDSMGPTFTTLTLPPDDGTTDTSFSVSYSLSDGSLTACTLDGASLGSCLSPISVTNLSVARHSIHLVATDGVGNSTVVDRTWVVPPVANFQDAAFVLGQAGDFTTNDANHGGVGADSFSAPLGISASSNAFFIGDQSNCRVLAWQVIPFFDDGADWILGQPTISSSVCPGAAQIAANNFTNIGLWSFALSDRLFVSDTNFGRVLVFALPISKNQPDPVLVLGQTSFTGRASGIGPGQMSGPSSIWSDGTRLAIADLGDNRVLFWTSLPTTNGESAAYELGGPPFDKTTTTPLSPPTKTSFNRPYGLASDGTRFVVADQGNSRVLIWNQFPTSSSSVPDIVLGQSSFTTADAGSGRSSLNLAYQAIIYKESLFVVDRGNRRILVWTPFPTTNAEAPHAVLGAASIDSLAPPDGGRNAFFAPKNAAIAQSRLYVVDGNRVLAFMLKN